MRKLFSLCVPLLLVSFAAQAGPFSRARTEGQRLDDAKPVVVDAVYVYSFLQEGAGSDRRLSKDIGKYLEVVAGTLKSKGVKVGSKEMPPGALTLESTPRGAGGIEGFKRVLDEPSKGQASAIVREYRDEESALPAGYRLLLLPETVTRSTGLQWGSRSIKTGAGNSFAQGAQSSGVPYYNFQVYWLLEDINDQPIAAGTTTGILDIRGFPTKPMAEQMTAELERLGISWRSSATE